MIQYRTSVSTSAVWFGCELSRGQNKVGDDLTAPAEAKKPCPRKHPFQTIPRLGSDHPQKTGLGMLRHFRGEISFSTNQSGIPQKNSPASPIPRLGHLPCLPESFAPGKRGCAGFPTGWSG
jgi:hypothetical protein